MPEVSHLTRKKPTPFSVDFGDGDTVSGMFDRNMVTPAWVENGRQQQFLSEALAEVILEWDVTNEGAPFAISAENMAVFSFDAQARLLEIIVSEAVPSRAEGNASSAPTSTPPSTLPEPQTTSPNGQATLPSLVLSGSQ
jgi:hypothetical protein